MDNKRFLIGVKKFLEQNNNKMVFFATGFFFLVFFSMGVFSLPAIPSCTVVEKPSDSNVVCWQNRFILVDDNVSSFKFLETPYGKSNQGIIPEELANLARAIKARLNLKGTLIPIPLPVKNSDALPDYGDYLVRINDSYNVRVLYGGNYYFGNAFKLAVIIASVFGIIALPLGIVLKILKKRDNIANLLIIIGVLIILLFVLSSFLAV